MPRTVLTILVALSVVLPRGFCPCQFERLYPQAPAAPSSVVTPKPARSCSCRRCAARTSTKQAAANLPMNSGTESREPTDHEPGCPAHSSWAVTRAVSLSPAVGKVVDPPTIDPLIGLAALGTTSPTEQLPDSSPFGFSALPPFLLVCCNLRC